MCLWWKRSGQIGSVDNRARSLLGADSGPDEQLGGLPVLPNARYVFGFFLRFRLPEVADYPKRRVDFLRSIDDAARHARIRHAIRSR